MRDPLAHLTFEERNGVVVGHVEGEIETANADELRRALSERLANDSAGLVLDLTATSYLDSAGIELLFELARRLRTHRQDLRLVVPADAPMLRVLELCDIQTVASIDATLEDALEGMHGPGVTG